MKKLLIAVPFVCGLFLTSCKKDNDELIIGNWEMTNIWLDNSESTTSYGSYESYACEDNKFIYYQTYSKYESFEWKFKESSEFSWTENSTYYGVDFYSICNDNGTLYPSSSYIDYEGNWEINEKGEGKTITVKFEDIFIEATILELTKEKLTVEFEIDETNWRIDFKRES